MGSVVLACIHTVLQVRGGRGSGARGGWLKQGVACLHACGSSGRTGSNMQEEAAVACLPNLRGASVHACNHATDSVRQSGC